MYLVEATSLPLPTYLPTYLPSRYQKPMNHSTNANIFWLYLLGHYMSDSSGAAESSFSVYLESYIE